MGSSKDHIYEGPILDDTEKNESSPIIIDVDSEKDNDCTIIDIDNVNSNDNEPYISANVLYFNELHLENKLFTELIEKYLDVEDSQVMLKIINGTLIPIYKNACEKYKKSPVFEKLLTTKLIQIDTLPDRKFTQIKALCEALKASARKRASFVTLNSNINGEFTKNNSKFTESEIPKKKQKIAVIDLVDDDDEVQTSCNNDTTNCTIKIKDIRGAVTDDEAVNNNNTDVELIVSESDSDIQINEQTTEDNDDLILVDNKNSNNNKENRTITEDNSNIKRCGMVAHSSYTKKIKERHSLNNNGVTSIDLIQEEDETGRLNTGERLFSQVNIEDIIRAKELDIASYNKTIKLLEESVVDEDSKYSPYYQSECLKAKVVEIYKEICKLKGTSSVKQHKVRLKVTAQRSKGPAQCLEQFINKNIDENGQPPFPDMVDVLNCVRKANVKYNMGLYQSEIQAEARALFIHYGRIVQKKRQKREWRHLMTYIKEEVLDPADEDLILAARLEENAKVAKKNENEMFDRFAKMENSETLPNLQCNSESSSDSDIDIESIPPIQSALCKQTVTSDSINCNINGVCSSKSGNFCDGNNITDNVVIYNPCDTSVQQVATSDSALIEMVVDKVNQNEESSSMIGNLGCTLEAPDSALIGTVDDEVHQDKKSSSTIGTLGCTLEAPDSALIGTVDDEVHQDKKSSSTIGTSGSTLEVPSNNLEYFRMNVNRQTQHNLAVLSPNEDLSSNLESSRINIDNQYKVEANYNEFSFRNATDLASPEAGRNLDATKSNERNDESRTCLEECTTETSNNVKDKSDAISQADFEHDIVKREPLDIPRMLEELGENFTATIIDFEDPGLVVEISDSESDDDDVFESILG